MNERVNNLSTLIYIGIYILKNKYLYNNDFTRKPFAVHNIIDIEKVANTYMYTKNIFKHNTNSIGVNCRNSLQIFFSTYIYTQILQRV